MKLADDRFSGGKVASLYTMEVKKSMKQKQPTKKQRATADRSFSVFIYKVLKQVRVFSYLLSVQNFDSVSFQPTQTVPAHTRIVSDLQIDFFRLMTVLEYRIELWPL